MKIFKETIFEHPKYAYCFSIELSDPDIDFYYEVTFKIDLAKADLLDSPEIIDYRKEVKGILEHEYSEFIKANK